MNLIVKYSSLFLTIILLSHCSTETKLAGKFSFSPGRINPGDEFTVTYNPDSSLLAGKENIRGVAYLYSDDLYETSDVPLEKDGTILKGKVKTDKQTLGVILKFVSDDLTDNNNNDGYVIFLSGKNGNRIPGSLAGLAAAHNRWGAYYLDMDKDRDKAFRLFEEEFKANPGVKRLFLHSYFETVYAAKLNDREAIIKIELENLEKYSSLSETDYELLATWYSKLGNKEKAKQYEKILEKSFPDGDYMQVKNYGKFRELKNVDEKFEFAGKFERENPGSKFIVKMYDLTANTYRDAREYDKAYEFLIDNSAKVSQYRFYIIIKRMLEENADMNIALQIAELGNTRNEKEVKSPTGTKPAFLSETEWLEEREYYYGLNLFAHGSVLYRMDRKIESIPFLQKAVHLTKNKEGDINELYSKVLVESGKYGEALDEIARFIQAGSGTVKMKNLLREAYLNEKGSEDGFDTFAAQFEEAGKEKLIKKLNKKLILEPAPNFNLKDIDGAPVSLSDYRGKTVIVDFWATWCGPCRESFPGMSKAVEKYENNESVKFFFINSWERAEDIKKNVSDFLAKHEYPFHVLLDDKNEVIEKYKVSSIPTKFVIDALGNIRFRSSGFEGSADQLAEEISIMISMVN